jgi:protein TonB
MVIPKNLFSAFCIILCTAFLGTVAGACTVNKHAVSGYETSEDAASDSSLSSTVYYVWQEDTFIEKELTKEPTILGEKDLMNRMIAINMIYPKEAREKMIGGTVIITAVVDEEGALEDAYVSQGVGGGCSEEALHAVKLLKHTGFVPAEVNGVPVKVKFDIPIRFALPGEKQG